MFVLLILISSPRLGKYMQLPSDILTQVLNQFTARPQQFLLQTNKQTNKSKGDIPPKLALITCVYFLTA
jgi:hypothetical protein